MKTQKGKVVHGDKLGIWTGKIGSYIIRRIWFLNPKILRKHLKGLKLERDWHFCKIILASLKNGPKWPD